MTHVCSGALFFAVNTQRFLLLHRAQSRQSRVWGLAGGTNELQETPWQACVREISEEIGHCNIRKTVPLESYTNREATFEYHTFVCIVDSEFIPDLNCEHDGYAWVTYSSWPQPLHYGLKNTLKKSNNLVKLKTIQNIYS